MSPLRTSRATMAWVPFSSPFGTRRPATRPEIRVGAAASIIRCNGAGGKTRHAARRPHVRFGSEADLKQGMFDVRFSNRPFGVKRFQTIHHQSVDVARGLVLLFGIGTRALPPWG